MSASLTPVKFNILTPLRMTLFRALVSLYKAVVFGFGLLLFVTLKPDRPVAGLVLADPGFVRAFFVW